MTQPRFIQALGWRCTYGGWQRRQRGSRRGQHGGRHPQCPQTWSCRSCGWPPAHKRIVRATFSTGLPLAGANAMSASSGNLVTSEVLLCTSASTTAARAAAVRPIACNRIASAWGVLQMPGPHILAVSCSALAVFCTAFSLSHPSASSFRNPTIHDSQHLRGSAAW